MLTDTKAQIAEHKGRPYKIYDSHGLYLLIHPNGSKYWRYNYRLGSVQRTLALGVYPSIKLRRARRERDAAKELVRQGICPVQDRRERKQQNLSKVTNTFASAAREWHNTQQWSERHAVKVWRSLEIHVLPAIGNVGIATLDTRQLLNVLEPIQSAGKFDMARRVRQRMSDVFDYAIAAGRVQGNPIPGWKALKKPPRVQHFKALAMDQVPEFQATLATYQGNPITVLALRLLLLTFVRPGELRNARWDEFNLEVGEWRIPAERMKSRREHVVPLSAQAKEVVNQIPPVSRDLVFPGSKPGKPLSDNTLRIALHRMGFEVTAHGFRTLASTSLNEIGFPPDIIEAQLAHLPADRTRAAYNRAEYMEQRREMMQTWADVVSNKVVPFKRIQQTVRRS